MPQGGTATPLPPHFVQRAVEGLRYIISGVTPETWFGPLQPLPPQAPPDVGGRQLDYPYGYNLAIAPRTDEPISFAQLRSLADGYDLLRTVIETRKDQIERLRWTIRCSELSDGKPRDRDSDPRIAEIEAFFRLPDGVHFWSTWLRQLLEDLFVVDAPTLYLRRNRGGKLSALEIVDGTTIKRLIDADGRTPAPPDPAYQQVLHGLPAADFTTEELIYRPRNLRPHKLYGYSPVEQIVMTVNIALRRQLHQLAYYTEGNVPEALIGTPESWTPQQIREFQQYWDALLEGNLAQRRHAKFVPGGVAKTFIPTRDAELKGAYDEWLARIVCFAFSISPQAFLAQMNRATAETAQQAALAEGLAPIQTWVKQLVDHLLITEFDAPDLEFCWRDERDIDPQQAASVAQIYVAHGIKTVNEARSDLGLDPVAGGDVPLVFTGSGPVPLAKAAGALLAKYSADQPRDERGRWTTGGGDAPVQIAANDDGTMSDAGGNLPSTSGAERAALAEIGNPPTQRPAIPTPSGTGILREYSPESATRLPPSPLGSKYITLDDGSVLWSQHANHGRGGPMLVPEDVSLADNAKFGERILSDYNATATVDPDAATEGRHAVMLKLFLPHGDMDYQRTYGTEDKINQDYVDVGYYNYGMVSAAAGFSRQEAQMYAGVFNRLYGGGDKTGPYGNKKDYLPVLLRGYDDYASGRIAAR